MHKSINIKKLIITVQKNTVIKTTLLKSARSLLEFKLLEKRKLKIIQFLKHSLKKYLKTLGF